MGSVTADELASVEAMVVPRESVSAALLDDTTRIEPYVVLQHERSGATVVRKPTMAEKLAYADANDVSVFCADEREQEEMFALMERTEPAAATRR